MGHGMNTNPYNGPSMPLRKVELEYRTTAWVAEEHVREYLADGWTRVEDTD